MLQRLKRTYGGTTPAEIAAGTQVQMNEFLQRLPDHVQTAVSLYTKLQQYNATISKWSIYQRTTMITPAQEMEMRRDQEQLLEIYDQYSIGPHDLHNLLQQMTWDTSATAKMIQSQLSFMNDKIAQRIQTAARYIVDACCGNDRTTNTTKYCLDVGCGYGALIPTLLTTTTTTSTSNTTTMTMTMRPDQIYGMDLSPKMIACAQELYPDCHFQTGDFLQYQPPGSDHDSDTANDSDGYFDGIIFCSSLHDMPNIHLVLEKAISLLTTNGTLVIVHAQGAGHVQMQHVKNPILVPQVLPTALELQEFLDAYHTRNRSNDNYHHPEEDTTHWPWQLTVAPAAANSPGDLADGYLAVIQRQQRQQPSSK